MLTMPRAEKRAATPGFLGGQHGWAYRAHPRRLVTFSLDGKLALPPSPPPVFPQPLKVDFAIDDGKAKAGAQAYVESCLMCHGAGAESGGYAPDLRAAASVLDLASFRDIVVNGSRRAAGMPEFSDLSADELVAIQHYIRHQAMLD